MALKLIRETIWKNLADEKAFETLTNFKVCNLNLF